MGYYKIRINFIDRKPMEGIRRYDFDEPLHMLRIRIWNQASEKVPRRLIDHIDIIPLPPSDPEVVKFILNEMGDF